MTKSKRFYTPADYLFLDRRAEYKNEYCAGKIVPMASGNRFHNIIGTNLIAILGTHLENSDRFCANRMRVKTPDNLFYTYPDLLVADSQPKFEEQLEDTLLNPILL